MDRATPLADHFAVMQRPCAAGFRVEPRAAPEQRVDRLHGPRRASAVHGVFLRRSVANLGKHLAVVLLIRQGRCDEESTCLARRGAAIQISSKDDIRLVLGRSPDKGDSVAMTFVADIPQPEPKPRPKSWRDRLRESGSNNGSSWLTA